MAEVVIQVCLRQGNFNCYALSHLPVARPMIHHLRCHLCPRCSSTPSSSPTPPIISLQSDEVLESLDMGRVKDAMAALSHLAKLKEVLLFIELPNSKHSACKQVPSAGRLVLLVWPWWHWLLQRCRLWLSLSCTWEQSGKAAGHMHQPATQLQQFYFQPC